MRITRIFRVSSQHERSLEPICVFIVPTICFVAFVFRKRDNLIIYACRPLSVLRFLLQTNKSSSQRSLGVAKVPSDPQSARGPGSHGCTHTAELLPFDRTSDSDRNELVAVIVHTADLSGQAYPSAISRNWNARIVQEFRAQACLDTTPDLLRDSS